MSVQSIPALGLQTPLWLSISALAGVARNLFGAVQFAGTLTATAESLVAAGLTPEQAMVMTGYTHTYLELSAQSRRWSTQPNAAVRPVEAAIQARRSIFTRRMTAERTELPVGFR